MHLLEAYKFFPRTGCDIRVYEFRGRMKKNSQVAGEENRPASRKTLGNPRSFCVAAENLYDATAHLREYIPHFVPYHVNLRGVFFRQLFYHFEGLATDVRSEEAQL